MALSASLPKTRLYVILARKSPLAVVFRRGPSKQVLLLSWNTQSHEFRMGQWLKGRIYEHRCDLSPSGEKLIYFAARHRGPLATWTAISRPPFLTALALWPKGDSWGGGGLFSNERTVGVNHLVGQMVLAEGFKLQKSLQVEPCGPLSGRGEDDPICSIRMKRDGWKLKQQAQMRATPRSSKRSRIRWEFEQPEIWTRSRGPWILEMSRLGLLETDGPWHVLTHRVVDSRRSVVVDLGRSDWADWSRSGELLFARDGRLHRVVEQGDSGFGSPEELIDLRALKFTPREAPPEALVWSGREPRGDVIR
jgi:hypothetical protein